MSKVILEFDTENDSDVSINAATRADDLALCLYLVKERIRNEWEDCDHGSKMEILIDDVNDIIENIIGCIDDYTE